MDIFAQIAAKTALWWTQTTGVEKSWLAIGVVGQLMFSMRWVLQWAASERVRTSVVPANFWYYSLIGSVMVLAYGIYKLDPVIILGQFGMLVYARNVYFLLTGSRADTPPDMAQNSSPEGVHGAAAKKVAEL
jgi:lipid-A-disaccharide synthase-like uncharacterized protein